MTNGLPRLATRLLSTERTGVDAGELTGIISGMLADRPRVSLILDSPGLEYHSARAHPGRDAPFGDVCALCRIVLESGRPLSVPDTRAKSFAGRPRSWPAREFRSFEGRPLRAVDETVGVLGLHSPRPHAFDANLRRDLALIADHLGVLLSVVAERDQQITLTGQLHSALATRSVIDHALGIVMARQRCDRDAAFDILRRLSNHRNVKINQLAAELVASLSGAGTKSPPKDPDPNRVADLT